MESSVNTLSDINITGLLDDIFSDVPLVATYLKILLLGIMSIQLKPIL